VVDFIGSGGRDRTADLEVMILIQPLHTTASKEYHHLPRKKRTPSEWQLRLSRSAPEKLALKFKPAKNVSYCLSKVAATEEKSRFSQLFPILYHRVYVACCYFGPRIGPLNPKIRRLWREYVIATEHHWFAL
jgi:hypothetical protein